MFLKVDNVGEERMSNGRQFQATGPTTVHKMPGWEGCPNKEQWRSSSGGRARFRLKAIRFLGLDQVTSAYFHKFWFLLIA